MIKDALNGLNVGAPDCAADEPVQSDLVAYRSGYNHSFAVLRRNDKGKGYRVDQYIGFRHNANQADKEPARYNKRNTNHHAVIVIDDADLGFRESEGKWEHLLPLPASDYKPWVILKLSHNIADGPLWISLMSRIKEPGEDWLKHRLVVLTAVARLRDRGAEISRDLSWQRSAYDVLTEIQNRNGLRDLTYCPYLILSFGPTGAILIDQTEKVTGVPHPKLIYNHEVMEGEWLRHHQEGMMFGYGSALCAALVPELATYPGEGPESPDLTSAVKEGLLAMQRLYEKGFVVKPSTIPGVTESPNGEFTSPSGLFDEDAANVDRDAQLDKLSEADLIQRPSHDMKPSSNQLATFDGDLKLDDSPLFDIALRGRPALEHHLEKWPIARFGELLTADQKEIESLRSIRKLIDNYCRRSGRDLLKAQPLAIAVFGQPGSGKSYAIKQLTKDWQDEMLIEPLTFNLSQFGSASELVGALHQVRDVALSGQVPLAFWDEFDAPLDGSALGWLKYFLAPIQDGKFQQEEVTHLIGPAIFVFAGGTSYSYRQFSDQVKGGRRADVIRGRGVAVKGARKVDGNRDAKGDDFLSRLRGYIDVEGIDSPSSSVRPSKEVMVRRALILNSLFAREDVAEYGGRFDVNKGVLHAFLGIPRYNHGARSMEAIVRMGMRRRGQPYERWMLPSEQQLDLHVPGHEFLQIMRSHDSV
ncbi:hypothetical protein ACWC09_52450 [Streptomyces sp. NPDC001617]